VPTAAVWCVFQRLPGEACPRLAAVCASPEAAESQVALSHREQEEMGESQGEWTIERWSVLEADVKEVEAADRISHALTGVRDALAVPPDEEEGGGASAPGQ
jgi:hypothetical protein